MMCVLCGELIMNVHWTEDNQIENGMTDQRSRRRSRLARVNYINQILPYYGLSLAEWNGTRYILNDKKGSACVLQDIGALWPAAEKMYAQPLDPLAPALLNSLRNEAERHA